MQKKARLQNNEKKNVHDLISLAFVELIIYE